VFYGVIYAIRASVVARIVEWLEQKVAPDLLRYSIEQSAQTGSPYAGQHQRDLTTLKNAMALATPTVMDVPFSALFLLVIYMISPVLGLIALLGVVLFVACAIVNEYATRKLLTRASTAQVESTLQAEAIGRSAEAICAMGMNDAVVANWQQENARGLSLQEIAQSRSAILTGFMRSIRLLLQVAVVAVGAWLALKHQLSAGGLIAASILVQRALVPFEQAVTVWKQVVQAREAYDRLTQVLRQVSPPQGNTQLPAPLGHLAVEGLSLYFARTSPPILRNISFEIQPGESLGIIGPSAAGKSTLGKALAGVFLPSMGTVRLDGQELFRWGRAEVGQYIGYLPQQVDLFAGSLKANIARLLPNVPDAAVIQAAQRAGVHELILKFENGYDTVYVPGNTVLSPGQKQRIGLARALFGDPRLVILDEPNSNLDGDGERALMHVLQLMKQAKITTVVIAHRPSILATVDKILFIRGGVVEAFGPREEILNRFRANRPLPEGGAS
jgi:PrtD family type I secretion system ABC transporter